MTGAPATRPGSILARVLIAPIRFYQRFISPGLPATCRYYPSCSAYAVEALQVHGAARGSWMAVRRIGRCHPWHEGGLDPVPPRRERPARSGSSGSSSSTTPHQRPAAAETPTIGSSAA